MDDPIRFKGFTFHPELGELVHRDESGRETIRRLAPQPGKLLLLLLENYPGILSREEIKSAIWPDVQVDFDRSLHYCVRQVRAALEDTAADPDFIETIPRRGYRWIVAPEEDKTAATAVRRFRFPTAGIVAAGLMVVTALSFFVFNKGMPPSADTALSPFRVAVMPFRPPEESAYFTGNDIALQLVESLTNRNGISMEVIGPTSTANYAPDELRTLIRDLAIDCVINGRFSQADGKNRLLGEIIRAEDGAHIWVQYFEAGTEPTVIVERIVNGFMEHFGEEVEAFRESR